MLTDETSASTETENEEELIPDSEIKIEIDGDLGGNLVECHMCAQGTTNKDNIKTHMRIHKLIRNTNSKHKFAFKCYTCGECFSSATALVIHRSNCENKSNLSIIKSELEKFTSQESGVKAQESGVKARFVPRPYRCPICDVAFARCETLERHKLEHRDKTKFKCEVCSERFEFPSDLQEHVRNHGIFGSYQCDVCEKEFLEQWEFDKHRATHDGQRPYQCEICGSTFKKHGQFKIHYETHIPMKNQAKSLVCVICGKIFKSNEYLLRHQQVHTKKRIFDCDMCEKSFKCLKSFKDHKRTVHTNPGEKPYKCDQCGKSFARTNCLWVHARIHSGEKPFKCQLCGRAFNRADNLRTHNKVHTGERRAKTQELKEMKAASK